jgi:hypothetical protein
VIFALQLVISSSCCLGMLTGKHNASPGYSGEYFIINFLMRIADIGMLQYKNVAFLSVLHTVVTTFLLLIFPLPFIYSHYDFLR